MGYLEVSLFFFVDLEIYIINIMQKEDSDEKDVRLNKVKEGFLIKRSRILKEWKKRWMVLTKNFLYSFESKGVYRKPTEKIPLKDVSTIKSFYKNQYERPQAFRIQSEDAFFYLSSQDHQEKWAWMTAIEKMTENIRNPISQDSQNLIRQNLRISIAMRQSTLIPRRSTVPIPQTTNNNYKLKLETNLFNMKILPQGISKSKLNMFQLQSVCFEGEPKGKSVGNNNYMQKLGEKIKERIVQIQKIVEVRVPVYIEKIVERQRIVSRETHEDIGAANLFDLFASLINSKLDDPKPLLDFVAFLGLSGIEKYQTISFNFCYERDCHRFFAQLLLQALNEQILEERLNRYTAFIYILMERENQYFYASDLKILTEIIIRQLQMYRSDLNQMINMQVLKTMLVYHYNTISSRRNEIKSLVIEIANFGNHQNRELAQQICQIIQ